MRTSEAYEINKTYISKTCCFIFNYDIRQKDEKRLQTFVKPKRDIIPNEFIS